MAKFDYIEAQNDAQELISEFGTTATISRVSSTYDETEGEEIIDSVLTETADIVSLPASTNIAASFENYIIEDYKKGKIRFFYMAAKGLTIEPQSGDLLFYVNKVWEIAGATPLNPAGTPVLYTLGVKNSNLSAIPTVTT